MESHAQLEIAHEVLISSIKLYEPPMLTCTCSQLNCTLYCDKPCFSQATKSCVEHVDVGSCDDLIAQENEDLKQEVEKLKGDLIKLKGKNQVQPSQDNRVYMVKKLENGSTATSANPQQDSSAANRKSHEKKSFGHIKCFKC